MKSLKTSIAKLRYAAYPVTKVVGEATKTSVIEVVAVSECVVGAVVGTVVGAALGATLGARGAYHRAKKGFEKELKCLKQF